MILLFVTAMIPLLLILSGLAVDLGAVGNLKDRIQIAADAAACAGASAIRFVKDDAACSANCQGVWSWTESIVRNDVSWLALITTLTTTVAGSNVIDVTSCPFSVA